MHRSITIPSLGIVGALVAGASLACVMPNPHHCHNAAGDQTCAERFGDERPFCVGPGETCEGVSENYGCVAELPPQECYSPCGNGTFTAEDLSCLGTAADEAETDTDSEGDDDGDGDGDGNPEPICGNGVVEGDEECGDGNTLGGDACTSTCLLPGAVIWERFYESEPCQGHEVVVTSVGDVVVAADCSPAERRLMAFDGDGEPLWNITAPSGASNVAISSIDTLATGGESGDKGQTTYLSKDGTSLWSSSIVSMSSIVDDVAIDGTGAVVAVGAADGGELIVRYSALGVQYWIHKDVNAAPLRRVVIVAGTQSGSDEVFDGLLVWFAADGASLHEVVLAGLEGDGSGDLDVLHDVVVTNDEYGVAVGYHFDPGTGYRLWVLKFAF